MLVVDIDIWPGGWADNARTIQRIAIWNMSELADVSDYEYVISRPIKPGVLGEVPSARWLASNRYDVQVSRTGRIEGHRRSLGAAVLVGKVLADA